MAQQGERTLSRIALIRAGIAGLIMVLPLIFVTLAAITTGVLWYGAAGMSMTQVYPILEALTGVIGIVCCIAMLAFSSVGAIYGRQAQFDGVRPRLMATAIGGAISMGVPGLIIGALGIGLQICLGVVLNSFNDSLFDIMVWSFSFGGNLCILPLTLAALGGSGGLVYAAVVGQRKVGGESSGPVN